ncbi:MAG: hypothetical protein JSV36_13545 [Anaerolineae bacterium]|nr:MAG: hypothetical protein JSV36_13545 [Anaerolineae bacterium]
MAMHVSQRKTATRPGEREIVDCLVKHVNAYQREVVVNYYVALKTKPFVILTGPPDVDKMCLAQGLYVLVQSVLPHVSSQWAGASGIWSEVSEYLAPRFPRAYAWVEYLSGHNLSGRGKT